MNAASGDFVAEMGRRIAFSAVAIPVVLGLLWIGGLPLAVLLATAAGLSAWEFFRLARASGSEPLWVHGVLLSAAVPLLTYVRYTTGWAPPPSVVMLVVLELMAVALWARGPGRKPLEGLGITLFGVFYTGGMLAFGYALRNHQFAVVPPSGALLVAFPLLLTWGTDTGALVFGRQWGRARLMPSVSPAKTIVGAWGGAVVAVVLAVVYVTWVLQPYARLTMSPAAAGAFGLVVSAVAQVGDLVESMFKRQAKVKDSSALIPGHGGALDRVDSLLFSLPVSFVLFNIMLKPMP